MNLLGPFVVLGGGAPTRGEHDRAADRGSATVQLVIATPVLLFCVLVIVQFALWFHASHLAIAAAQEGNRAARVSDGSAAAGQARAESFLEQSAHDLVHGARVVATRDATTARVEVSGYVVAVIPGLRMPLRAVSQSAVERFVPETGP